MIWLFRRPRFPWFWPGRTPVELLSYFSGTRHPAASLAVVVPLLLAYEGAVLGLTGGEQPAARNGADAWLRNLVPQMGAWATHLPPVVIVAVLVMQTVWWWREVPGRWPALLFGMVVECLMWSLSLWALSLGWPGIIKNSGVELSWLDQAGPSVRAVLPLIGAGVYEEFLFRLAAVGLVAWALRVVGVGGLTGWCVAAIVSSWFFAAAHHWGPMGQAYSPIVFSFRMAAGVILCVLARFRGFSIAVGTHLLYNLIVGLRPVAGLP